MVFRVPTWAGVPNRAPRHVAAHRTPSTAARHRGGTAGWHEHHFHLLAALLQPGGVGAQDDRGPRRHPEKAAVEVGDTLVFHDRDSDRELDVVVKRITPYASFEELLSAEDCRPYRPGRTTRAELCSTSAASTRRRRRRSAPSPSSSTTGPARPGRPMPMTPSQYAQTVPHHTVYGCLYVRDEHDRPVQLRSVYGNRLWQFPGGNTRRQARTRSRPPAAKRRGDRTRTRPGHAAAAAHALPAPRALTGRWTRWASSSTVAGSPPTSCSRIRLDPAEHDMWAVHDLDRLAELMAPRAFARLDAIERARRGEGPAYLVTHT